MSSSRTTFIWRRYAFPADKDPELAIPLFTGCETEHAGARELRDAKRSAAGWLVRLLGYSLTLLSSLFDDPHSGLVEVLARFPPLVLWWTAGRLLVK